MGGKLVFEEKVAAAREACPRRWALAWAGPAFTAAGFAAGAASAGIAVGLAEPLSASAGSVDAGAFAAIASLACAAGVLGAFGLAFSKAARRRAARRGADWVIGLVGEVRRPVGGRAGGAFHASGDFDWLVAEAFARPIR